MSLISFNAPNNSDYLSAICGHLYDISKNTEKIGYDIRYIREELTRIADSAEVIAGTKTKEEVIAEKAIEIIRNSYSYLEDIDYDKMTPIEQAEVDEKYHKIEQLQDLLQRIKQNRQKEQNGVVFCCWKSLCGNRGRRAVKIQRLAITKKCPSENGSLREAFFGYS